MPLPFYFFLTVEKLLHRFVDPGLPRAFVVIDPFSDHLFQGAFFGVDFEDGAVLNFVVQGEQFHEFARRQSLFLKSTPSALVHAGLLESAGRVFLLGFLNAFAFGLVPFHLIEIICREHPVRLPEHHEDWFLRRIGGLQFGNHSALTAAGDGLIRKFDCGDNGL